MYVCCSNGFWFSFYRDDFCYCDEASGCTFHESGFSLLYSKGLNLAFISFMG